MSIPVILAWSGGKDSALALSQLQLDDRYEIVSLLTTFTRDYERVSMHGVRRELIVQQAERLKIPLAESWINKGADNASYEAALSATLDGFKTPGVRTIAFGDLYLEDIRAYRENVTTRIGMNSLYPIWGMETLSLARKFIADGFIATTCCVDTKQIPEEFCGRRLDFDFLNSLPESADPCGENGEFHTFVHDCPLMSSPIEIEVGEMRRDGQFTFRDLLLAKQTATTHGEKLDE